MVAITQTTHECNATSIANEINALIPHLPKGMKTMKRLLKSAPIDVRESVHWEAMDCGIKKAERYKIQSAFIRDKSSAEEFEEWTKTEENESTRSRRAKYAEDTEAKAKSHDIHMRYRRAYYEPMTRRYP